jgi:membrane protease YdiL (CAAX protease family)
VAETKRYKGAAALAVLFTFIWPLIVNSFGGQRSIASARDDLRTVAVEWILVAILAAFAFGLQRARLAFFRITMFGGRDLLRMLGLLVVMYGLIGAVSRLVAHPKFDLQQLAAIPFGIRLMLPITAGVCEEFMFRGFAIEEIGMLTGSRWPGAALSVVFFGLGHVGTYGFSSAVFLPMTIGLVITVLYMWRNNLPLCMLMHTVIDSVSLLLVPALTKH